MSRHPTPSSAPAAANSRAWGLDAAALSVIALAVRVPAYLASAHLDFDDGVYGASAIAMRRGGVPFRDVFSSQGPLHLPIVFAGDLLGGRSSSSPRLAAAVAGVVAAVAVYAAARRLTTRFGALLAGGVVALSGSVLWTTGPITADGPAIALGATAVALSLRYRCSPSALLAVSTGAVFGAAISVKAPLVLAVAIPVAGFLLAGRRPRGVALAAGSTAVVVLAAILPWGAGRVWDQSVVYQVDSARNASLRDNAEKILSTLWERDPFLLAVAALVIATIATAAIRRRTAPSGAVDPPPERLAPPVSQRPARLDAGLLAAWLVALTLFLVAEPAMWRNHIAHLVAPAALVLALRPPSARLVALVALVALPFQAAHLGALLSPDPYTGDAAAAVAAMRSMPAGARAISDDPGFVWRAGRSTPFDLVDASIKRIRQGRITAAGVSEAAADRHVCAVLIWSAVRFGSLEALPDALEREGYSRSLDFGTDRALYERADCAPPG